MDQITKYIKSLMNELGEHPDTPINIIEITNKKNCIILKMTTQIKINGKDCPFTHTTRFPNKFE